MSGVRTESDPFHQLIPETKFEKLISPWQRLIHVPSSSGLVLIFFTLVALIWANSTWSTAYHALWHTPLSLTIGTWKFEKDLLHLINDGLMTIFFFVVGLEIKREIVFGELRDPRQAALPIIAALGGMIVPALVYAVLFRVLNLDATAARGWAIPMATDIAFVVGVLAILGPAVPSSLKILLLTLAIVDDLGAILVIAFVFTETLQWGSLLCSVLIFVTVLGLRWLGLRSIAVYVCLGVMAWFAVLNSGVHPTIAGVILGLMTPAHAWMNRKQLLTIFQVASARTSTAIVGSRETGSEATGSEQAGEIEPEPLASEILTRVASASAEGVSPLDRLVAILHPWVSFGIMPVFALANAGVTLKFSAMTEPVALAISAGLVFGKPIGILLFSAIAIRIGLAKRPETLSKGLFVGGACLAGIGFTMSIFLVGLSLPPEFSDAGKIGTLMGSLISVIIGSVILIMCSRDRSQVPNA